MQMLLGLLAGIAFGFILRRSRVANAGCIRGALALTDFHMLKLLMTAVGVGMILAFPLNAMGLVTFSVKSLYVVGVGLGGLIFGAGMAVAGFCPGTMLAAAPGGNKNIWWALAGALAGSFAYALVYEPLKPILNTPLNYGKLTLPQWLGLDPLVTALVVGPAILVAIYLFDRATSRSPSAIPHLDQMGD